MEIGLYKRYIYLPHHIIALTAIVSVWKNCPIYDSLLMFFFAESSAFITNFRGVLGGFKDIYIIYIYFFNITYFDSLLYFYPTDMSNTNSLVVLYNHYKKLLCNQNNDI